MTEQQKHLHNKNNKTLLSARSCACLIVQECVANKSSLSTLLPQYLEQVKVEQRAFVQEISFGVLRWYYRLQPLLETMLSKPLKGKKQSVHYILLIGLYQLIYLNKAEYAVVKETVNSCVELKQTWAKGLVNAILRRFLREQDDLLAQLDQSFASHYAYPEWLIEQIKKSWGQHSIDITQLLDAGNQRPPMTLRINQKIPLAPYKELLHEQNISYQELPNSYQLERCLILDKPISVDLLPDFFQGSLSVQDGSPQFAAQLLQPQANEHILDACAAPGGKTMHLLEFEPNINKVIALDISSSRLERIKENSQRLKIDAQKLDIIAADASSKDWWDGQEFDRILLDAPCSATGVIRRHPDIKLLREANDISQLAQLQAIILDNLWDLLKPNGRLLYATCSILRDENDHQIEAFFKRQNTANNTYHVKEISIDASWGIPMSYGRQILTGQDNLDGFYYAILTKELAGH